MIKILRAFTAFTAFALFTLIVQDVSAQCEGTELEPNDYSANATDYQRQVCDSARSMMAVLGSRGDRDWYKFSVTRQTSVNISLSHDTAVDFDVFLYRATGPYIAYGGTVHNPERLTYVVPPGTYYVRVKSYRGRGSYTLYIDTGSK